ncbi:MAG: serine dehydratase subunit alpha family protein, partial [Candidatus Cloacimonadales bacterium]|nr:serine dehydratase subunit alpha family protein [Candidatus Cloacimonadota bacterium]MCB5256422.1 serine dehydratase subunit alpha family protein [Candidatus Cloacimonadota bacterium]MCB5263397.1 serine dehydratase subunit alpha family protein [Candidatus Cloacimonadota bacterium]
MQQFSEILALMRQEVVPALGCTEPAAVALAASFAASVFPAAYDDITVIVSQNILKNGMGVGIPNTGLIGLEIAAALGLIVAKPERELQVLADIDPDQVEAGKKLAESIDIQLYPGEDKVYIEV